MASRLDLTGLPKTFDVPGDPSRIGERWKKYIRGFQLYIDGRAITQSFQKYSLLLSCAGEDVQDIFETLGVAVNQETEDPFAVALGALNSYFLPKSNVTYERHLFRQITQASNETVDQYCTQFRSKSKTCNFQDVDGAIKDQLVEGVRSTTLRRKFLEKGDSANLADLLHLARVHEQTQQQALNMGGPSTESVHKLDAHSRPPAGAGPTSTTRPKVHQQAATGSTSSCYSEPESDDEFVFGVTDNHKAEKVSVMIGGVNVPMIIDSGAIVNVIGRDVWEDMKQNGVKCTMMKADKKIYAYGSTHH
ncbi:hypothetical protein RRG08_013747 [Elysia crispata]|uniref:Retrotransposon gag domain-containing protein n=1 Tax=Elysia crispata TaxID=231223 RepID=A0AAE1DKI0_9GAST|nr:hypothetical protein RRG08_013747 [Elysia crispata]